MTGYLLTLMMMMKMKKQDLPIRFLRLRGVSRGNYEKDTVGREARREYFGLG
jgi:hypothetical protein